MKLQSPSDAEQGMIDTLDVDHLMADTRWQPLLDLLPDAVILVDRAGLVRHLNRAAEAAFEVLRVEAVGGSLQDFVSKSALDVHFALEAFLKGGKTAQAISDSPTGQWYSLSARTMRDWNSNNACFLIVARASDPDKSSERSPRSGGLRSVSAEEAVHTAGSSSGEFVLCDKTVQLVERGLKTLQLGSRLLLVGESGVGKTELARHLHRRSGNPARPFVHVNCGSVPDTLFESEMFGYERGSFTGALAKGKRGLVEAADGGVLFLDEVGEIPLPLQAKMLQFLEDGVLQRVGGTQLRRLRVQVISATNRELLRMVADGRFRKDLYYRLGVVALKLPPLRDCPDLIDELIDRFLDDVSRRRGSALKLDRGCRQALHDHGFPGNIRELQNVIEYLAVVCGATVRQDDVIAAIERIPCETVAAVPVTSVPRAIEFDSHEPLRASVRRYEGQLVLDAIARTGSKRKAAALLGVDIATVVRKSRQAHE